MVGSIRVHYLQCCVFQMFSGIEQPAVIFLLFLFYYQGILNPVLNPQHLQERLHSHSTFQSYQPLETLYITNRIHLFKHIHKEPLIMYIQCFLLNAVEGLYQGPVIIHYACVIWILRPSKASIWANLTNGIDPKTLFNWRRWDKRIAHTCPWKSF